MILNGRMFKFSVPTPGDHRSPLRTNGTSCAKSSAINGNLKAKSQFIELFDVRIISCYRRAGACLPPPAVTFVQGYSHKESSSIPTICASESVRREIESYGGSKPPPYDPMGQLVQILI